MENTLNSRVAVILRNGMAADIRTDALVEFDERSKLYQVASIKGGKQRSYTWNCGKHLNQGNSGKCVGFAIAHEFAAAPKQCNSSAGTANAIYNYAQKVDKYPDGPGTGTSLLAGCKAAKAMGWISAYNWCMGLQALISTVGYKGPVVIAVPWNASMNIPGKAGFLNPRGKFTARHALLCKGVNTKGGLFVLHNSWGTNWGKGGDCYITYGNMDTLLANGGEAVVFSGRECK